MLKVSFSHRAALAPVLKTKWPRVGWPFCSVPCCPTDVGVDHYSVSYCLKSCKFIVGLETTSKSTLYFFCKITWGILDSSYFHVNFTICPFLSKKAHCYYDWDSIESIEFWRTDILQVLFCPSLVIQNYGIYIYLFSYSLISTKIFCSFLAYMFCIHFVKCIQICCFLVL